MRSCKDLLTNRGVARNQSQPQIADCLPRPGMTREIHGELLGSDHQIAFTSLRAQAGIYWKHGSITGIGGEKVHDPLGRSARVVTTATLVRDEQNVGIRKQIELPTTQPAKGHDREPAGWVRNRQRSLQCPVGGNRVFLQGVENIMAMVQITRSGCEHGMAELLTHQRQRLWSIDVAL